MNRLSLGLLAALAIGSSIPVFAQTTQTSPAKPSAPMTTARTPAASASAMVDINSASAADLDKLPGIGKARADAIIKNRPYKAKDDLLSRHIVPQSVFNRIKDKIVAR